MLEAASPLVRMEGVLDDEDIAFLKRACKAHFAQVDGPCYTLIDEQDAPTVRKIKGLLEDWVKRPLFYLNDFYLYTDDTFATSWHMDTELFTFAHALNAWILLSPDRVVDPLCFFAGINESEESYYHNVEIADETATFRNYRDRRQETRSLAQLEAERIHTPEVRIGDMLVINPRRFHRTNVETPKHCVAIKFVYGGDHGILSDKQVPAMLWPEVKIFSKLVRENDRWEDVVQGIREALRTEAGLKALNAGNYPEKIELYKKMVQLL